MLVSVPNVLLIDMVRAASYALLPVVATALVQLEFLPMVNVPRVNLTKLVAFIAMCPARLVARTHLRMPPSALLARPEQENAQNVLPRNMVAIALTPVALTVSRALKD